VTEDVVKLAWQASRADSSVEGLSAVATLRARLRQLEETHVDQAVSAGWSWAKIAEPLGVSKQAVHKKHGKRVARQGFRPPGPGRPAIPAATRRMVAAARREARARGQEQLETGHLLLGVLQSDKSVAVEVLRALGASLDAVRDQVRQLQDAEGPVEPRSPGGRRVSRWARQSLEQAVQEAASLESPSLEADHVLLALLRNERSGAMRVLKAVLGATA
jgi:hypothetical protein